MRGLRAALLGLAAVGAAGCALPAVSPSPTVAPSMLLVDRRPGQVAVLVNGVFAGQVACGANLVLSPGAAGLPPLP
jgi:hypothetical protein